MDWLKFKFSTLLPYIISFFLGYLSSLVVARQTRTEKNLSFSLVSREIIFENFNKSEFELKYKGNPVENLYVLVIRAWNKGRDRILSGDNGYIYCKYSSSLVL